MGLENGEDPPPKSTDIEGWRRAVENGRYRDFRMEEIVAAVQDLGPGTDKWVLNPLAKHLSDVLLRILRRRVDISYPNRGEDIIERVHGQLIEAVFTMSSADGQGLRTAFVPRVEFRIKDALAFEKRAARNLYKPSERGHDSGAVGSAESPQSDGCAPNSYDDLSPEIAENVDVERILQQVTDDQKRLAFRLHMDGVPFKSKKTRSISSALGISEKTAREWIKEVQALLSTTREVQDLIESRRRASP